MKIYLFIYLFTPLLTKLCTHFFFNFYNLLDLNFYIFLNSMLFAKIWNECDSKLRNSYQKFCNFDVQHIWYISQYPRLQYFKKFNYWSFECIWFVVRTDSKLFQRYILERVRVDAEWERLCFLRLVEFCMYSIQSCCID